MKRTVLQHFSLFFYERRETTYLFWAAIVIFGALSYSTLLKRQGFPNVDVPITVISGTYFAGDETRLDREVTGPASEIISSLDDVKAVTSVAGDNFFTMEVEFEEGETTSRAGAATVREALDGHLPAGAQLTFKPIDAAKYAEQSDLLVSIYSESADLRTLERQAQDIASELDARDGVARASVLKQFETGLNPVTGQATTEQRHFDRLVFREDGELQSRPTATIGVAAAPDKDALELSEEIKRALPELAAQPEYEHLQLRISADLAEGIEAQLDNLELSLLQGLVAVLVVSLILISGRASLTGALSMITVLLMTLGLLHIIGYTLNTVTLFALILSLGLIVDDTTIMVEAVDAGKRGSRRRREVVASAVKRVARASTAGTFTTMLGFAPMLFVSGILGEFIRILPVTIIISLAVSLLVSLTLVPFLSSRLILRGRPRQSRTARLEKILANKLARALLLAKRSQTKGRIASTLAIGLSVVLILVAIPLFQRLKFDIFPATKDTDTINVSLRFTPGTTIAEAEAIAYQANQQIMSILGENLRRISYQNSGSTTSAVATVNLVSYKDREPTSQELIKWLEADFKDFPYAGIQVNQVDVGPPRENLPFHVQVTSEDRKKAQQLAADIRLFLDGRAIQRASGNTSRITRAEIATPDQIRRVDARQTVEVQAGFDATDTSALVTAAQEVVEAEFTPEVIRSYGLEPNVLAFDFGSESGNQESFRSMLVAFPFLLLAMYLLMVAQFRSFTQPFLIFLAIPFSFFGVALGLYLTNNPLSFFVLVGFFALIGIVVNNTIMLTDYANQARSYGLGKREAMAVATAARFRPLITTSLTTMVALIPLALQDPFWESLSVTLIFGLFSSTLLVLLAFPYYYLAGEDMLYWVRNRRVAWLNYINARLR